MSKRQSPGSSDDLADFKRRAAIKLEADLHAYLDALSAVGVSDDEAIALARSTLRSAFSSAPQQKRTPSSGQAEQA